MWKCPSCGTQNNDRFCAECGAQKPDFPIVEKNEMNQKKKKSQYVKTPNESPKKKGGKLKVFLIVFAVIFVAASAFAAGILYMDKKDENRKKLEAAVSEVDKRKEEKAAKKATQESSEKLREEELQTQAIVEEENEETEGEQAGTASDTTTSEVILEIEETEDEKTSEPVISKETAEKEEKSEFLIYTNADYGFYCAYPAEFISKEPKGINAVRAFVSPDGTAEIIIRANANTSGLTAEAALSEFVSAYGDSITYKANGKTWYAASVTRNGRSMYRKFFATDGSIYCMDFEMNESDKEKYSPHIEYMENNFGKMN